jgi:hypothetical protein
MRETKTKEQLEQLLKENKDLLMSSDETKVREKIMWLDNFFNELKHSLVNLYENPRTSFIYSDIINFTGDVIRPYFQNIEAEAAGAAKPILIFKREIARFEYCFKHYILDHILTYQNRLFHHVLVRQILKCDFESD